MYWFLVEDLDDMSMKEFLGYGPESAAAKRMWSTGRKFDEPLPPEDFRVRTRVLGYGFPDGDEMPDLIDALVTLMSSRLLGALAEAGVDNIDSYPVRIVDAEKNLTRDDYRAVNVIGRVDALDRSKTKTEHDIESYYPAYQSVVIDEDKASGRLCFHLHKGPRNIVLHDTVARHLASLDFKGIKLVRTEDFGE